MGPSYSYWDANGVSEQGLAPETELWFRNVVLNKNRSMNTVNHFNHYIKTSSSWTPTPYLNICLNTRKSCTWSYLGNLTILYRHMNTANTFKIWSSKTEWWRHCPRLVLMAGAPSTHTSHLHCPEAPESTKRYSGYLSTNITYSPRSSSCFYLKRYFGVCTKLPELLGQIGTASQYHRT
jgi:hypothetical protein